MTLTRFNIILSFALILTGCFTGIESTPKITSEDVKKEQVIISVEDNYLSDIKPQQLSDWNVGKAFLITDEKIALAVIPTSGVQLNVGDTLKFKQYRIIPNVTGGESTELIFAIGNGEATYKVNASYEEINKRDGIVIPFTIELSIIDKIGKLLSGKNLYIRTATRYNEQGEPHNGKKYVKVKIIDILPGNSNYPIRVKFTDDNDDATATPSYLYMSIDSYNKSTRNFASLFSFNDIRNNYPQISDENWQNIINSRVALDMTRDECRLALGAPASISRRPGISTLQELWTYENGVYLIFDDGLLRSFRQ